METTGSLTAFFYNVVPGVIFVLGLISIFTDIIKFISDNEDIVVFGIFILLVLGQFFGFCFQGITKITRKRWLNYQIWKKVVINNRASFNKARETFKGAQILKESKKSVAYKDINKYFENLFEEGNDKRVDEEKLQEIFYLMDNYLHAEGKAWMPLYYTARLAFWSNIFFGFILWFLLYSFMYIYRYCSTCSIDVIKEPVILKLAISGLFIFYSGFLFEEYLYARYDVVLKSFISVVELNKEENKKRGQYE